jgi:hypothetical protein
MEGKMGRLIVLVLLIAAVWYGYKHYPALLSRSPSHEAVVVNATSNTVYRIRLGVGGQTFVKESLGPDQKVAFPFKVNDDASFDLIWEWDNTTGERHWRGGTVFKGPMVARHVLTIQDDDGVVYMSENKGAR